MIDNFILPITFKDKEFEFPARLIQYGYSFKIEVEIEGNKWLFERDEERNWRAGLPYEEAHLSVKIDKALLEAVSVEISNITT